MQSSIVAMKRSASAFVVCISFAMDSQSSALFMSARPPFTPSMSCDPAVAERRAKASTASGGGQQK
jgi:hypothetical protein